MKKILTTLALVATLALNVNAQGSKNVGIGTATPNASALLDLDVSSTDFATKLGLLVPRMTAAQRDAILNPADGLLVYVTDGAAAGFYYRTGATWKSLSGVTGSGLANQIAYFSSDNNIATSANLAYNAAGDLAITNGNIDLLSIASGAAKEVRFHAGNASVNYVSVKAPTTLAANVDFTLPNNAGTEGQVLTKTATGTAWQASSGGGTPSPSSVPAGAMMQFAGATAPDGWLLCDGSAVSRADNADLYSVIGTTYGVGDGSSTFNLPNMSGRMPIGVNTSYSLGTTGGSATTTLTTDNLPAHTHQLVGVNVSNSGTPLNYTDARANGGQAALYANDVTVGLAAYNILTRYNAANERSLATESIKTTGAGTPVNTLPPYTAINYIIKK